MTKIPKKLGELLVEGGILTETQLSQALETQAKQKRLLGEIIVELGLTTKEKLDAALARQYGSRLGEILINQGLIGFAQLQESLNQEKSTLKSLGEILINKGYVSEPALMQSLSKQYQMPYVKLSDYKIHPDTVAKLPLDALKKYCVLPVDIENGMLVVATANPEDVIAEADLRFLSGMYIKFVLASKSELLFYLE